MFKLCLVDRWKHIFSKVCCLNECIQIPLSIYFPFWKKIKKNSKQKKFIKDYSRFFSSILLKINANSFMLMHFGRTIAIFWLSFRLSSRREKMSGLMFWKLTKWDSIRNLFLISHSGLRKIRSGVTFTCLKLSPSVMMILSCNPETLVL